MPNLTKTPKRNVPNLLIGSMHEPPPDTMSSNEYSSEYIVSKEQSADIEN